jgi:multidrug efflux pump subunit AcrA (membrane-fusion protein)
VYQQDNKNLVYVVNENEEGRKVARLKPVSLGVSYKHNVVINDGLQAGDQLITIGSSFLQDQMRINIVDQRDNNIAQTNS